MQWMPLKVQPTPWAKLLLTQLLKLALLLMPLVKLLLLLAPLLMLPVPLLKKLRTPQ